MKNIKASAIHGIMRLFAMFPLKVHYFFADIIAFFLEKVICYRQAVVYTNLARSFPGLQPGELKQIAHDFYVHMAEIIVEAIWFGGCDLERVRKARIVEMANVEVIDELYRKSPSVAVFYSHCGNWELLGGLMAYNYDDSVHSPFTGGNTFVVYKELRNPLWNEILYRNRIAPMPGFNGLVESSSILRFCIRHRQEKNLYHMAMDQFPYEVAHDVGLFLNQRTKGMLGGIGLAQRLGFAAVYMKYVRTGRGHYRIEYVKICDDASQMSQDDLLRRYYELLEEEIIETPANWLWSHKRWK